MSSIRVNGAIQRKPSIQSIWIIEMYDMLCGKWVPYSNFANGEGGEFENRELARKFKKVYEYRYSTVYFRVTRYWSERAIEIVHIKDY